MILMMEEIATRLDFDELFNHLFLRNVAHNDILRVLLNHSESVWNSRVILCFLSFESFLEVIKILASHELWMLNDFSKRSIARCDVSLNNLLEVLIIFITDLKSLTNVCTDSFVILLNIDVDDIALIELPSQCKIACSS